MQSLIKYVFAEMQSISAAPLPLSNVTHPRVFGPSHLSCAPLRWCHALRSDDGVLPSLEHVYCHFVPNVPFNLVLELARQYYVP